MMIGETKLGYKITELVGQGGFGTVYKAVKKNKALETVRALKHISLPSRKQWTDIYNSMGSDVVRTDAYFDAILQEILNEIRILADLTSKGVKNVVWYYENEIEDTPSPKHYDIYLLMEYLTPLPTYIENHEIKIKDVIKIGTDILSALIECHKRKIIHRDIKTDNIFVSEEGDYKLGDFGVSKKLSDRSRATSMKGTPNYIAPEIYLGQEYDETVDLYSLGIVLYRLLNYNRNPFMPNYPESYDSDDEDRAFELRMKGDTPNYPVFASGELGDVIIKAISNKENRYKCAEEFKNDLERVLKLISNDEREKVVLEKMIGDVDFSTFGSKNGLTQMANDDLNNETHSSKINLSKTNLSNNISAEKKRNKSKFIIPAAVVVAIVIGTGIFFGMRGKTEKGERIVQEDGVTKFIKKNGDYAQNEWIFFDENEYYFNGRQSLVTNDTVETNGKTYFVGSDGAKVINNWYKSPEGKEYYLDENGEPFKNTAKNINDETYFFNDKGEKVKNDWFLFDGNYYYIDSSGKMLKDTLKEVSSTEKYYLGSDGKMLKDTFYDINGNTYYFESNGMMKMDTFVLVGSSVYYAQADGTIKKNGWCANNQYYADGEGKILVNTTTPDGTKVDETGKRVEKNVQNVTKPQQNANINQQTTTKTNLGEDNKKSNTVTPTITDSDVIWGDHLRISENVYLDDWGEENGVGRINIDVTKLKDDGTEPVKKINDKLKEIFDAAYNRSEIELPYKYFDLDKTTIGVCTNELLVIYVAGSIKYLDNSSEKIRYKVTYNKTQGDISYEQVK